MLMICAAMAALPDVDDRAFMQRLWQDYRRYMFFTARRYARDDAVLEDIVSESLMRLMEKLDTLRGLNEIRLQAYIRNTVRSQAVNALRADIREARGMDREALSGVAAPEDPAWRRIELAEELELLLEAVERLPENERRAVKLRYGEGKRDAEIAAALGVAESTVRKYLAAARQKLKRTIYADGGYAL